MLRRGHWLIATTLVLAACSDGRGASKPGGNDQDMSHPAGTVVQTVVAPGTPSDAPSQFGGSADASVAPKVVYPASGVIMPPNISELEIQWVPAPGTTVFKLEFVSTYLDLSIFTICNPIGSGCGYAPDATVWQTMATQARGDTMTLTVSASSGAGTSVGEAAAQTLSFTQEDLMGGLYYWNAAVGEIDRYDFGQSGQSAEVFYNATQAGSICVGCHSLARNGTRIAVGLNAPLPLAGLSVVDIASAKPLFTMGASNFEAFSPDASRLLANDGAGNLNLLDGATGMQIGTAPVVMNANLPDWSADGSHLVFARSSAAGCPIPAICASEPGVSGADLYTVDVSGDTFGMPSLLVTGGGSNNNYYPTWSPDGSLVAFNRSASNQNSFDSPDARLWVVGSAGGTPIALTNASATASNVGDSWPKFAPFSHHFQADTIFWLTFSSRRDYGLRIVNSAVTPTMDDDPRISQIWMVGVPASAVMSGSMPAGGYTAFWLPFQSMKSGNHIAQWTETIARQPCSTGVDPIPCPTGQNCMSGECVGIPIQ